MRPCLKPAPVPLFQVAPFDIFNPVLLGVNIFQVESQLPVLDGTMAPRDGIILS